MKKKYILEIPEKAYRIKAGFERKNPSVWHIKNPHHDAKTVCGILIELLFDPPKNDPFNQWEIGDITKINLKKMCKICLGPLSIKEEKNEFVPKKLWT